MGFTAEAITLMEEILSKIKSAEVNKRTLRSLRSRARNTPSLIMGLGLPQTLAFIASKSDTEYYGYLVTGKGEPKDSEESGYSAYLYIIMRFLTQEGVLEKVPSNMEEVVKSIKKLDEDPQLCSVAQSFLNEFLLEFKKVAEALIEEEG